MKEQKTKRDVFLIAAILITVANIILVWAFRFLPLFDYPIWLYEVRIMRAISEPQFMAAYDLVRVPVPNLGFVVPVYFLSFIVSIEVAGKIFLSLCVVGLPWSFWFAVRKLSNNPNTPIAFAAFPFAFSIYFYSGQAFLLGLIVLLLMIGSFLPRFEQFSVRDWILLSLCLVLSYFIHALSFVLAVMVFGGAVITVLRSRVYVFITALIPSLVCLIWYFVSSDVPSYEFQWSVWGLAQNVFKPVFLFIKSYGLPNPLPLTLLNLGWAIVLIVFVFQLFTSTGRSRIMERKLLIPIVLTALFVLTLPEIFLGVVQPGGRFGLPILFLIFLMCARVDISDRWKSAFLSVALLVNVYNAFHFRRVDEQMQTLFSDITLSVDMSGMRFLSVRFDWPPERATWDVAAASVDPLFGALYYAALSTGGPTQIFGTALLRPKAEFRKFQDHPTGSNLEELSSSVLEFNRTYFGILVLVGNNEVLEKTYEKLLLERSWFVYHTSRPMWKVLGAVQPKPGLR